MGIFLSRASASLTLMLLTCSVVPVAKAEKVLELFTSHSCYSCPPAEALFNELAANDESLIALEFHVDYWNTLVYGKAGSWVDPFSDAAYSQRQRQYDSKRLQGRRGVYTPQAIVNGRIAAVGSDRNRVTAALRESLPSDVRVSIEPSDNQWQVKVDNPTANQAAAEASVWLVRFIKNVTTEVTAGENKGLTIENHNVVISMQPIGVVPESDSVILTATMNADPNEGCAVLVQDNFHSPILAAARCPG